MIVTNLDDIILDSPTICIDIETQDPELKARSPGVYRGDADISCQSYDIHTQGWLIA